MLLVGGAILLAAFFAFKDDKKTDVKRRGELSGSAPSGGGPPGPGGKEPMEVSESEAGEKDPKEVESLPPQAQVRLHKEELDKMENSQNPQQSLLESMVKFADRLNKKWRNKTGWPLSGEERTELHQYILDSEKIMITYEEIARSWSDAVQMANPGFARASPSDILDDDSYSYGRFNENRDRLIELQSANDMDIQSLENQRAEAQKQVNIVTQHQYNVALTDQRTFNQSNISALTKSIEQTIVTNNDPFNMAPATDFESSASVSFLDAPSSGSSAAKRPAPETSGEMHNGFASRHDRRPSDPTAPEQGKHPGRRGLHCGRGCRV